MDSERNKIVIVDDDITILINLQRILEYSGYNVKCANNGKSSLSIIEDFKPELILLDIKMDDINGIEICKILKSKEMTKNIPIIFLSAEDGQENKIESLSAGGIDFIRKPFQINEILLRIKIHIEMFSLQKQLEESNKELKATLEKLTQTQEQLIQSEKMASLLPLTEGVAHEINNPLNFISTSIAGVKEINNRLFDFYFYIKNSIKESDNNSNKTTNEKIEEIENEKLYDMSNLLLNNINKGTERVTEIIKGLREFSRKSNDIQDTFNIHDSIDLTLMILHNEYKDTIEIVKNYGKIAQYKGQKSKMNQVFLNIIKNGIEAINSKEIKENESIKITTYTKEYNGVNSIFIEINDTGIGINNEITGKIFDPFFTTKPVGKGLGLGLPICYNIIKNHKGEIAIINNSKGTTFQIILPILE